MLFLPNHTALFYAGVVLKMARTRTQETASDEWSCPLCTLLNTPEDDRCAACDNARPPVDQLRKSQSPERPTAEITTFEVQHRYRPASGVFFSSLPINQGDSGAVITWKQEPRLTVNRRRGIRRRNADISGEMTVNREQVEKSFNDRPTASTAAIEEETKVVAQVPNTTITVDSIEMMEEAEEKREEEDEDTGIDVEEPSFNLLGSGASVFAAPPVPDAVENQSFANETNKQEKSEEMGISDDSDIEVLSPPPKYPGFMPASNVLVEETRIEEKLASAGLGLSDSEDDGEPKMLRRHSEEKDNAWEDKWVCQICTNLNDQTVLECSSCKCKRYQAPVECMEPAAESALQWACHICTNLNPPEETDCLMCLSTRRSDKTTGKRWKCSVCSSFNESSAVRCELCDRPRDEAPEKAPGNQGPQCSVCTNINPPGKTRCELCDSSLLPDGNDEEDQFVDSATSIQKRMARYLDEDDLENPYADLSQYDNNYNAPNEVADADLDNVEEISDNEQPPSFLTNPRPVSVREELREFENFVSMEDLRRDYGCRINFNQMFAGQRSGKSYSDRLATRTAASRKRKRTAAQIESGELSASAARKGKKTKAKTAKGGKKRKSPAAGRRASEGGAMASRGKRARKTASTARRSSSATTHSSGINHYDDSAADFGEDLNTMAWEGVGSAGYL